MPGIISLGPFDLTHRLGQGGMAAVWAGVHRAQGVQVAVKVITGAHSADPLFVEAFREEVRAVAGLDHPHIVRVFEQGRVGAEAAAASEGALAEGSPFLAMELAGGGTLREAGDRLGWQGLHAALVALLGALAHAHARGLIHLDLKPDNVLLAGPSDAWRGYKLGDFGIAHALDRQLSRAGGPRGQAPVGAVTARTGLVVGTPWYMAPEQYRGDWRSFGPWTDLYALGCLGWELATGLPPFPMRKAEALMWAHIEQPPPPFVQRVAVPEGFEAWLRRLLSKAPGARFTRAADAAFALAQLAEAHDALAPEPTQHLPVAQAQAIAASGARTLILNPEQTLRSPSPEAAGPPPARPPLPPDWRGLEGEAEGAQPLLGAGMGLFGLRTPPLVGRVAHRDALWFNLQRAVDGGQGRVVLLRGAAGTGKSRLAEWLATSGHACGAVTVLRAVFSPDGGPADGLGPMLARHWRCVGLARRDAVARLRSELGAAQSPWLAEELAALMATGPDGEQTLRGWASQPSSTPEARSALVAQALRALATERPVLLWLEDLQWGHEGLQLVDWMLKQQRLQPTPWLVVATVQEEALAQRREESALLPALLADAAVQALVVPPLEHDEHAALVRALLGLDSQLAAQLAERSAGNPLFAVQLVGDWVERGLLEVRPGGYALKAGAQAPIPDDLHKLWRSRVRRALERSQVQLQPQEGLSLAALAAALELAAVLGLNFSEAEWRAACDEAGLPALRGVLPALVAHQLLNRVGQAGQGHSFAHGMLRESLIRQAKEAGRWRRHHQAVAQALTPNYGQHPAVYAERLARHLLAARAWSQACEPLLKAAQVRRDRSAYTQALSLLSLRDKALATCQTPPADPAWGEGWMLRCQLNLDLDRADEAHRLATQVEAAARRWGWAHLAPRALEMIGKVLRWRGEMHTSQRVYRVALVGFKALGDPTGVADCLRGLADAAWHRGDLDGAEALYLEALGHYQHTGEVLREGSCELFLGHIKLRRHAHDAARAHLERAMARFEDAGSVHYQGSCYAALAQVAIDLGDWQAASAFNKQSMGTAERTGSAQSLMSSLDVAGDLARRQGKLDEAQGHYRRSLAAAQAGGRRTNVTALLNLAHVCMIQGRDADTLQLLEGVLAELDASGRDAYKGWAHGILLAVAAQQGRWGDAAAHLGSAEAALVGAALVERDDAEPIEVAADRLAAAGQLALATRAYRLAQTLWGAAADAPRAALIKARAARLDG